MLSFRQAGVILIFLGAFLSPAILAQSVEVEIISGLTDRSLNDVPLFWWSLNEGEAASFRMRPVQGQNDPFRTHGLTVELDLRPMPSRTPVTATYGTATGSVIEVVFETDDFYDWKTIELNTPQDDNAFGACRDVGLKITPNPDDNGNSTGDSEDFKELLCVVDDEGGFEVIPGKIQITEGQSIDFKVRVKYENYGEVHGEEGYSYLGAFGPTVAARVLFDDHLKDRVNLTDIVYYEGKPYVREIRRVVVFAAGRNEIERTITLTAKDDDDFNDDEGVINFDSESCGGCPFIYNTTELTVTILDDDSPIDAPESVVMQEGSTKTFEVKLLEAPTGAVTVEIAGYEMSDLAGTPPSPSSLTFTQTDYRIPRTVTLTAGTDPDQTDDTVTLTLTSSGPGIYDGETTTVEVTITDKDKPDVEFSSAAGSVNEGAGTPYEVAVTIDPVPETDFTLFYTSEEGSAITDEDYTTSGSVSVSAGVSSVDISVTIIDDRNIERTKTVILELMSDARYTIGTQHRHKLTITDNDVAPEVTFASASNRVDESLSSPHNVTINIDPASASGFTLTYTLTGDATLDEDYAIDGARTVRVPANAASVNISVMITEDNADENNEKIILTMVDGNGYDLGRIKVHTLTITDNDTPETAFSSVSYRVDEGVGTHKVAVTIHPVSVSDFTLTYTLDGTATPGEDYIASKSVSVPANSSSVSIPIMIEDDPDVEGDETVILTLTDGTGYTAGSAKTYTLTITDNDVTPGVNFALPASSVGEGDDTQNVTININPVPATDLTLRYSLAAGSTATEGTDYSIVNSGTLDVEAGVASANIPVKITDDGMDEEAETVILILSEGTGYTVGSAKTHTLTITDNDETPEINFALPVSSAAEGEDTQHVTISIDPVPAEEFTVKYSLAGSTATEGTDYSITGSGTIKVAADAASVSIPVKIIDDSVDDDNEFIMLTLTDNPGYTVGMQKVHTLTITDNDTPEVSFTSMSGSIGEAGGTRDVSISVRPAPAADLTLNYSLDGSTALEGADYRITGSGTVKVDAKATSVTIPITITDDSNEENDEMVILTLISGTGYTVGKSSKHTLTITDNDGSALPKVAFASTSASAGEGVGSHDITVSLSSAAPAGGLTLNYRFSGSATRNTDYTGSESVPVTANETSVNIPIAIIDDNIVEPDETVILMLTSGTGYNVGGDREYTLMILDDDAVMLPEITFASDSDHVDEAIGIPHNVTVSIHPVSAAGFMLAYSLEGTAQRDTDYRIDESIAVRANAVSVNIPVRILDDDLEEDDEKIILTLETRPEYTVGTADTYTLTITDNDEAVLPEVAFALTSASVGEDVGTRNVTVSILPAPAEDFSLNYRLEGTAQRNTDYTSPETVLVRANATSVNIPVTITDDDEEEGDETVILTLAGGTGYKIGSANAYTLTITDNDGTPPVFTLRPEITFLSASASVGEDVGTYSLTVRLSAVPEESFTLNYQPGGTATEGADYTIDGSGAVSVAAGATAASIVITIADDSLAEDNETIILTLTSGTGYDLGSVDVHTLTITNNDATVTLSASPNPVAEGDAVTATATLTKMVAGAVTIPLVFTPGTAERGDYSTLTSIVINPDNLSGTGAIMTSVDNDPDDETFTVALGTLPPGILAGPQASMEIRITDAGTGTSIESPGNVIPSDFSLEQNYPNPFNPSTAIEFSITKTQHVLLTVYDMLGQRVRTLMDGTQPAGHHSVLFDGSGLASDTYIYVLQTEKQRAVKIMTLLK